MVILKGNCTTGLKSYQELAAVMLEVIKIIVHFSLGALENSDVMVIVNIINGFVIMIGNTHFQC